MTRRRSRAKKPSLQATRTGLAVLKKKGIFTGNPKKAGRSKANLALVRKYKPVIAGKATVFKLPEKMAKRYRKARIRGLKVTDDNRIIIDKKLGYDRAEIIKGDPVFKDMVAHVRPLENGEIQTVILPEKFRDIINLLKGVKESPDWNGLKKSKENFTFRVDGAPAHQSFRTLSAMADYLSHYRTVEKGNARSRRAFTEIFEIVRVKRGIDLRENYEKQFKNRYGRANRTGRSSYRRR